MRHLGEVRHHRVAADILAQRKRQTLVAVAIVAGRQDLAQDDLLAVLVREFDADDRASRNRRNTGRQGRHRPGDVIGQPDHAGGLQTRRGFQLVHRHDRAGAHTDDLALHAIVVEHRFQHPGVLFQRLVGEVVPFDRNGVGQKAQRRVLVGGSISPKVQRRLRFGLGLTRGGGFSCLMLNNRGAIALQRPAGLEGWRRLDGARGLRGDQFGLGHHHVLGHGHPTRQRHAIRQRVLLRHRRGGRARGGVEDHRLRPARMAAHRRFGAGGGRDGGLADPRLDHIGDLGLDAVFALDFVIRLLRKLFVFGPPFQKRRDTGKKAAARLNLGVETFLIRNRLHLCGGNQRRLRAQHAALHRGVGPGLGLDQRFIPGALAPFGPAGTDVGHTTRHGPG